LYNLYFLAFVGLVFGLMVNVTEHECSEILNKKLYHEKSS